MARAKKIEALDCAGRATEGARLVLAARMEEMCALREAAIDWSDPEGVHDMRVASRRLRSAMGDFKNHFRKRRFERLRERVKRIADTLGSVRDEDVAIIALDDLTKQAPADAKGGIQLIAGERRARRESNRAALVRAISNTTLAELQAEFSLLQTESSLALNDTTPERSNSETQIEIDHEHSFMDAGRKVVTRRLRRLNKSCRSLLRPFDVDRLHQARIEAKRLRYALELYESCWEDALAPFIEQISEMQSSLGELHDCDVWIADLGANLRGKLRAKSDDTDDGLSADDAEKRRAAVWLLSHFTKMRTKHFRAALERWHDWETRKFFNRLRQIIVHDPLTVQSSSVIQPNLESSPPRETSAKEVH